jgi:hypothetical protein
MKNYIFLLALLIIIALPSCTEDKLRNVSFDVDIISTSYNVGDTVKFNISGDPDLITFYSGEHGKCYENIDRTEATGTPILQFTTLRENGTESGNISLMISSDFEGISVEDTSVTVSRIKSARWKDISNKASLSTGSNMNSGEVDLSQYADADKPVFIAFKYVGSQGQTQSKWTIKDLTVTNTLSDGSVYTIADLSKGLISNYGISTMISPGWVSYSTEGDNWWNVQSTSIIINGTNNDVESWVFSGPINLKQVVPDLGVAIQDLTTRIDSYTYVYEATGTYKASFVGSNNNVYGIEEVVKTFEITVE